MRQLGGITDSGHSVSQGRDREAWSAAVHVVTKSQTRLSNGTELLIQSDMLQLLNLKGLQNNVLKYAY